MRGHTRRASRSAWHTGVGERMTGRTALCFRPAAASPCTDPSDRCRRRCARRVPLACGFAGGPGIENGGGTCGSSPIFHPGGCVRRCPTLPHPGGCSTIGAVRLSFRVRDGTGRFPDAVTTVTFLSCSSHARRGVGGSSFNQRVCWLGYRIVDASRSFM